MSSWTNDELEKLRRRNREIFDQLGTRYFGSLLNQDYVLSSTGENVEIIMPTYTARDGTEFTTSKECLLHDLRADFHLWYDDRKLIFAADEEVILDPDDLFDWLVEHLDPLLEMLIKIKME